MREEAMESSILGHCKLNVNNHSSIHHHYSPFLHSLILPTRVRVAAAAGKRPILITAGAQQDAFIVLQGIQEAMQQVPPTWNSALVSSATIFVLGYPLLRTGLSLQGIAAAYVLGTLTWRAFGALAFLLVVFYFLMGTAVTKIKLKQKEREGIAESRSGKRGPASVWGSGTAGAVCAMAAISGLGGATAFDVWQLGFAASFATKLSDTVSSEIGKAFGKTTYLVTTFTLVPRGTEGAISLEGTLAGLSASILFTAFAYVIHQITAEGAMICIIASQIANVCESYAGATIQDKEGFEWLNNDLVNVLNISLGAALAMISFYMMNASKV